MIYMFCLYHFSLKCKIKKIIYHRTVPLNLFEKMQFLSTLQVSKLKISS